MTREHREVLRTLAHLVPDCPYTKGLVYAFRDTDGNLHHGSPVQMRPWEWLETLGDHLPVENKDAHFGDHTTALRNNTSLPLEMFEAKALGESSRLPGGKFAPDQPQADSLKTLFENDLISESICERAWRESRTGIKPLEGLSELSVDTMVSHHVNVTGEDSSRLKSANSTRASPSLSVGTSAGSRSTMAGPTSAASSMRRTQSPALSGTEGDWSKKGSNARGKRKASSALTDDSAPTTVSSRGTSSRGRGSTRRSTAEKGETEIPIKMVKKKR